MYPNIRLIFLITVTVIYTILFFIFIPSNNDVSNNQQTQQSASTQNFKISKVTPTPTPEPTATPIPQGTSYKMNYQAYASSNRNTFVLSNQGTDSYIRDATIFKAGNGANVEVFYEKSGWSSIQPMNGNRTDSGKQSAIELSDGRILVIGGNEDIQSKGFDVINTMPLKFAEIYDPITNSWTDIDLPIFGENYHLHKLNNGQIFVYSEKIFDVSDPCWDDWYVAQNIDNIDCEYKFNDRVLIFDPENNSFFETAPMISNHSTKTVKLNDGRIVGLSHDYFDGNSKDFGYMDIFDPQSSNWKRQKLECDGYVSVGTDVGENFAFDPVLDLEGNLYWQLERTNFIDTSSEGRAESCKFENSLYMEDFPHFYKINISTGFFYPTTIGWYIGGNLYNYFGDGTISTKRPLDFLVEALGAGSPTHDRVILIKTLKDGSLLVVYKDGFIMMFTYNNHPDFQSVDDPEWLRYSGIKGDWDNVESRIYLDVKGLRDILELSDGRLLAINAPGGDIHYSTIVDKGFILEEEWWESYNSSYGFDK